MKRSELTSEENEFIEKFRRAERENDTDMLICLCALLDLTLERQGSTQSGLIEGFTRGQYKRAIKLLRATQAMVLRDGMEREAADFDRTARYIREHCLNCHVEEGKKTA